MEDVVLYLPFSLSTFRPWLHLQTKDLVLLPDCFEDIPAKQQDSRSDPRSRSCCTSSLMYLALTGLGPDSPTSLLKILRHAELN